MPIVVAHQPSALGIGAVAFQAGLGQYRARQEEMDLRKQQQAMQWAQMALQNQASLRNDMLQAQQMQDANQRFMLDRGMQAEQFNARQGENVRQFDVHQKAQDQWRVDQQKMEADRRAHQTEMQNRGFEFRTDEWAAEAARQEAIRESEPERKARELEAVEAAKLNAEGLRTQTRLKQQLEAVDAAVQAPNSRVSKELADQVKQRIRNNFAGIDMNRLLAQSGSPEEAAAAARAELEQNWNATTITRPDGTMWQRKSRNGEDSWEQIGVKIPANQQLANKEHLALNQLYTKEATEHFRKGGELDPLTGQTAPVAPFPSFDEWKRGRQMTPGGEGEPPMPPADIASQAIGAAANAPPDVQEAVAFLASVARIAANPQALASLPPDVRQRIEQAKMTIQTHRARSTQPTIQPTPPQDNSTTRQFIMPRM